MKKLIAIRVLLLVLAVAGFAASAAAQSTGGRLRGTVSDASKGVVPGAEVTIVNAATGITRSVQTDASGDYIFPVVAVGTYTVQCEVAGFKKYVRKGVTVQLNEVVQIDVALTVGGHGDVIEVTGAPPLVDTSTSQLGAVVNERAVVMLPLASRDTYQLLQLQPGVQSQVGADLFYGSDRAGVVSVNGGRGRDNNFSVNGGDGNDLFVNLPAVQPAPDTIGEFRVLTNTFDAEYGRNSGAVVNVVTKSGTNEWHGNAYDFFRNKVLNARGFFETAKSDFLQNQFGATLGGPIKHDRTFFFASYEGRRLRRGVPSDTVTVPTPAERAGDFSAGPTFSGTLNDAYFANVLNNLVADLPRPGCAAAVTAAGGAPIAAGTAYSAIFVNNVIPTSCFDPTAADLLRFVQPGTLAPDTFQSSPLSRERNNQFTIKVDHEITKNQHLTGYYYLTDEFLSKPFSRFQAGGATLPGFGDLTDQRVQQINVTHTWAISQSLVNEARFTYFREGQGTFNRPQRTNVVQNSCASVPAAQCFASATDPRAGITPNLGAGFEGVPFITVGGSFSIGNNFEGQLPQIGQTYQWSENLSKVWGKHTLKFGGDFRHQRFDQTLFFNVNGDYGFTSSPTSPTGNDVGFTSALPNYLMGLPTTYLQGSAQQELVRSNSYYLYAQDSWKIRPNVTLNYGLRWELNTPLADIGKKVQTFRPGQVTSIYPCQLSAASITAFTALGVASPNCANTGVFPTGLLVPGDSGVPNGLTKTDYKAFAPRIGMAWSPGWKDGPLAKLTGGPGKSSVRMGWGMFYNPVEQLVLEQFSAEPPFGGSTSLANNYFNLPFRLQDGSPVPNPFNGILNPPRGQPVDWSLFRPILLFGQLQPNLRTQYSVQYNLNIQRELWKDIVLQIGYVGRQGHRLLATHDLNFGNAQTCNDLNAILGAGTCFQFGADSSYTVPAGTVIPAGVTLHLPYGSVSSIIGPATIGPNGITLVGLRPFSSPQCQPTTGAGCPQDGVPVFSSIFAQDTVANSNYNALQIMVEKRFSHGLQLQGAYTWSKSIDNASSFESILNPLDFRRSRALSLFDSRHRFVLSYYWEFPIPKKPGFAGKVVNGWALSGITTFQSGFPIRITSADDNELMFSFDFELPGQPNVVGPFRTQDPRKGGCALGTGPTAGPNATVPPTPCDPVANQLFDPNLFSNATVTSGTIGNAPRSICCGPGISNFEVGIQKVTPLSERTRIEFRAEFFNIWNHAQFVNPSGNISNGSDFGRVNRVRDPRLVQFAVKFFF